MLNFLRDLPRTWHMNLKQFIFTIGLLIALAASATAQAGTSKTTGYSSLVTSTTRDVGKTSTVPVSKTSLFSPVLAQRFCNRTGEYLYHTNCMECHSGKFEPCRLGDIHALNISCHATVITNNGEGLIRGCSALCKGVRITKKCCRGYWGADCSQTCPGGSQNPCNGHGTCIESDGRCICPAQFKGEACELCKNEAKYGPDCVKYCMCAHGECNSGIYGDGACRSPCDNLPCGTNSHCLHTGPGTHRCVCNDGYTAIGERCLPEDLCQINNGGCDDTQDCIHVGSMKNSLEYKCQCKTGYEQQQLFNTCKLKEMCTPGLCGHIALCETREPLKHSCICPKGHTWNGQTCSGNIIERLQKLPNEDPRFVNNLGYMYKMASKVFDTLLSRYGPFTIFVPTDEAFRKVINDTEFEKLLNDDNKIKRILHQHIVAAECQMIPPSNLYYNLQGNQVDLHTVTENNKTVGYYTLSYDTAPTERTEIIASNILAVNGAIYIISDVMGLKDDQFGDHKGTAMDLIKNTPEYSTMYSMIMEAGLSDMFSEPNTTVLITNNRAWGDFSVHESHFLVSEIEGLDKLREILENHAFLGTIDVTDLVNMRDMKSYANNNVKVQVSDQGQIKLDDDGANITRASIPVSSGLCHLVDKVLVPSYSKPLIGNICEDTITEEVVGPCVHCRSSFLHCPESTVPTGRIKYCSDSLVDIPYPIWGRRYFRSVGSPWSRRNNKCSQICSRKTKRRSCCGGFYGRSCIACPGGLEHPCSGNGKCSDGESGTGECSCTEHFTGTSCNRCAHNDTFGPHCDQACTCQFGKCDTGPQGTGRCKPRTCQLGYTGENCDEKLVPCESDEICEKNSKCFLERIDIYSSLKSCHCSPGYEDDWYGCSMIDLCAEESNACHRQATCSQEGPGASSCTCNNGWHGDGFQCTPNYPCDQKTDCHKAAVCHDVEPGKSVCTCAPGYRGNGLVCELVNKCLENNGGCHKHATCTFTKDGERNCTCPQFMSGDGVSCRGVIYEEVINHPSLTSLTGLMKNSDVSLALDTLNGTYTFFAPSNDALESFFNVAIRRNMLDDVLHKDKVLTFLKFHTIYNDYTTDDLMALDGVMRRYPTLFDGYSLRIVNTNQSLHIFVNQSTFAVIEEANIPAYNGYIHIIDKVLEPFIPDDKEPSLSDLLKSKPQYRVFYEALQSTKLLENVSSLHEYTLFVLPNKIVGRINRKLTADYLSYYIVPERIFTPNVIDGDVVDTLLGSQHRLKFTLGHEVYVNDNSITRGDILTDIGVIHELASPLHPVLNRCDVKTSNKKPGPCGDCKTGNLTCHDGFTSLGASHVLKNTCLFKDPAGQGYKYAYLGCNQMCVNYTMKSQCCAGFYGYHCEECPGGAENPCSGNGVCNDGGNGLGRCKCNIGFAGTVCDRCDSGDLVPPYCNISYNSCEYMNGNCSDRATCKKTSSGITCKCFLGYIGDGRTCRSKCYSAEHGECHSKANCVNTSNRTFRCECNPGFHGNGTWCQQNSDPCTSNNGGCDLERAVCNFTEPKVTDMNEGDPVCECESGYVGNGKLCSADLLDAISRIPVLSTFHSWLLKAESNNITNITGLLSDRRKNMTVFISVSKVMTTANIAVVDGIFQLPNYSHTEFEVKNTINKDISKMVTKEWKFTSLNGQEINVILNDHGRYLVNGVRIVRGNIQALNGILHLIATRQRTLEDFRHLISRDATASHVNPVIAGVATAVIVVLVALISIVIYKKWHRIFRHSPTSLQCNIAFSKISTNDSGDSVSIPDNAEFHNPLFNDQSVQ